MKSLILLTLLTLLSTTAYSQNWLNYDNKTYVGGIYATLCNVCVEHGRYNNDTHNYWQCTNDNPILSPKYKGNCSKAIARALYNRPVTSEAY